MAIRTMNMSTTYKKYLHLPVLKKSDNKSPLYALADGCADANDAEFTRTPEWLNTCKITYNSPTNARKIFISMNYVLIQFYKPIIVGGKPDTNGTVRLVAVKEDFQAAVQNIYARGFNPGIITEDVYRITGHPLAGILAPWVLTNVEEIYIDSMCLMSEDIMAGLFDLGRFVTAVRGNSIKSLCDPALLISRLFGQHKPLNDILKSLPRLKYIAVIGNLDNLIKSNRVRGIASRAKYDDTTFIKCALDFKMINLNNCIVYKAPAASAPESGIIEVRNRYKFDTLVLGPYAAQFKEKTLNKNKVPVTQTSAEANSADSTDSTKNVTKSDFEIELLKANEKVDQAAFMLAVQKLDAKAKKELANSLTDEALARYGKFLTGGVKSNG